MKDPPEERVFCPIFIYFLLLLLFAFASKLSSQVCEPDVLDLLISVKSVVQLCTISRRVLHGSLVFNDLSLNKADIGFL